MKILQVFGSLFHPSRLANMKMRSRGCGVKGEEEEESDCGVLG